MSKKGETYIRKYKSLPQQFYQIITVLSEPFLDDHSKNCRNKTGERIKVRAIEARQAPWGENIPITIKYLDEFCDFEEGKKDENDSIYHISKSDSETCHMFIQKMFTSGISYN